MRSRFIAGNRDFLSVVLAAFCTIGCLTRCTPASASGVAASSADTLGDTLRVRATFTLCPEYRYGGIHLEVKYRIGGDSLVYTAPIITQSVDQATATAALDVELPATMQTVPLILTAYCVDGSAPSDPSNEQSVTNCDRLALHDTDGDGIANNREDLDCSNFFSPGDASNPDNIDTDGDGIRDLAEVMAGSDPADPGVSPKSRIISGAPFDTDGNGDSNDVAWRPSTGYWYIKDGSGPGRNLAFQFGLPGDTPFTYKPANSTSDVGVVRRFGTDYVWYFHGEGFLIGEGTTVTTLRFGNFGDNLIPGPWEGPGTTSPAVARLFDNSWAFYIYRHNGTVHEVRWGENGDVPMVQDYDGDGVFDVAVFRPRLQQLFIINSTTNLAQVVQYGSGTADYSVRGDYTGDSRADVSFWEPLNGMFYMLKSEMNFRDPGAIPPDPRYAYESQLGLYQVHVPLSWIQRSGHSVFTVVNHETGVRYSRTGNSPTGAIETVQWGVPGDSLG